MKPLLYKSDLADCLLAELRLADTFDLATAALTTRGLDVIRPAVERLLARGGACRILVGIDLPTDPDAIAALIELGSRHPALVVRRFQSPAGRLFHPKLALITRPKGAPRAIVGSSNLTGGGLEKNYEANVLIDDRRTVAALRTYFDELFDGGYAKAIDPGWLAGYRTVWARREKVDARSRQLRDEALSLGRKPKQIAVIPKRIMGHTFAFTGRITDRPREQVLYPLVRRYGGDVVKQASGLAGAHCLVHGDILGGKKSTMKLTRARTLKLPILTADEFEAVLDREKRLRRPLQRSS